MCAKKGENKKIQRGRRTAPKQQDISNAISEGEDIVSEASSEISDQNKTIPKDSLKSLRERTTNQRARSVRRKQPQPKKRDDKIMKEIKLLQSTTKFMITKLTFQRCVREILQEVNNGMRLQSSSLECLQESAEQYMTQLFEDSYLCCAHRSHVTLNEKDMGLALIFRGLLDPGRR